MKTKFARPSELNEALSLLADDSWFILSGGTDFYPAQNDNTDDQNILDVSGLNRLGQISSDKDYLRIGARVTWADIAKADLPPAFNALKLAAREIGAMQIQHRATLAGNLCNASPAADGVPPLLILDAKLRLQSAGNERIVPLHDFITGNRTTKLHHDEMVTEILIPRISTTGISTFQKLGARKYLVISITMVAARLTVNSRDRIVEAAVAVGACSAVAKRMKAIEYLLIGRPLSKPLSKDLIEENLADLAPITDVRATAEYRRTASAEMINPDFSSTD